MIPISTFITPDPFLFDHFIPRPLIWHRGPRPRAHWYMCTDQNHDIRWDVTRMIPGLWWHVTRAPASLVTVGRLARRYYHYSRLYIRFIRFIGYNLGPASKTPTSLHAASYGFEPITATFFRNMSAFWKVLIGSFSIIIMLPIYRIICYFSSSFYLSFSYPSIMLWFDFDFLQRSAAFFLEFVAFFSGDSCIYLHLCFLYSAYVSS